jgi:hypothetical protein
LRADLDFGCTDSQACTVAHRKPHQIPLMAAVYQSGLITREPYQEELRRRTPYPPRTIVEVSRLNQDDVVEIEGTFYCPVKAEH